SGPAALAGTARSIAARRAMRTAVSVLAGIVSLCLLIVGTSTVMAGRMAVVLAVMHPDTAPLLLLEAAAAVRLLRRMLHGCVLCVGVDHRLRGSLSARAVT